MLLNDEWSGGSNDSLMLLVVIQFVLEVNQEIIFHDRPEDVASNEAMSDKLAQYHSQLTPSYAQY